MADTQTQPAGRRDGRRVNGIGVVMALIFLTVASVGIAGNPWWLLNSAAKWIIAGAIAAVGLGLLATALPGVGRSRRPPGQPDSR